MSGKRKITIRFSAKVDSDPSEFIARVADRLPNDELNFEVMEPGRPKPSVGQYVQDAYTQPLQTALDNEPSTPLKGNKNERAEAEWKERQEANTAESVDYVHKIQEQGGRISGRITDEKRILKT